MLSLPGILKKVFGIRTDRSLRGPAATAPVPKEENLFQVLADHSADLIVRLGPDHVARYVSPSSLRILGWTPEEMVGQSPENFVLAEDIPVMAAAVGRIVAGEAETGTGVVRMLRKDGSAVWTEGSLRMIRDPVTGAPGDLVVIVRDITDRKALEDKLTALAMTDGLTGLMNRRAFDQALEREWQRTLREGTQMSLLLLDLDHFKMFNDHYGHQVGDDCLRAVAAAVQKNMRRPGDVAARYGGEELAVILPNTDATGAVQVAGQLRLAVEVLHLPQLPSAEHGDWLTVSIGAATVLCREGGRMQMPEALLAAADAALYRAKRDGRNCVANTLLLATGERS
ncbi:PAS domain S-box-containing protein/diguanylate cyclase (GGDEF)-like protein [Humitalea rosea]|uniref:diguanylate cyclase n=1 Tax=Humitalea rosea TaxID=990373 RepID=A0A2W7IDB9_9PROT|nr:sensor domain-containing diguanylate cyclase [Humitalea rosea]PZW44956.1 PAS domain S-box-containing protein/diguanylate cyclase (GGDEF)-like protein [Humitalea rosea]